MTHHSQAVWEFPVGSSVTILFTAFVYLRGWLRLRSTSLSDISAWRAGSFLAGLFLTWIAAASPLATLDHELLTVHMIQHLLLMTFAAPLILLGEPVRLLLHGVPRRFRRAVIDPCRGIHCYADSATHSHNLRFAGLPPLQPWWYGMFRRR